MNGMIRWEDPFAGLTSLHSQLDDMFNDVFTHGNTPLNITAPALDIYNDDDTSLVVEVQAPGFTKDDITVQVHEGVLEIKGEKVEKQDDKKDKRHYMIRESSASFYRRIALPKHADGDSIDAHFDNGIIKITVPFKELPQPKKVHIKSSSK
ncbi:MAG: hypothetical protein NVSMB46_05510 [Candidatus Saccharimonadales bacterium]